MYPARSFYPSMVGHPCDRHIAWRFNRHMEQDLHDHVLQSIFDHGQEEQPMIYRRLEEMGFEIVRESDRPIQYPVRKGSRIMISGRPDGRVIGFRVDGSRVERYKPALVLEAKSLSGYQWDRITSVDDIRYAETHWTRGYYAQGQLYCFLENVPRGLFALRSKSTGMLKLIPFELDFGYAERLLQRLEGLVPAIEKRQDPEPIAFDLKICGGCGFRKRCYPPKSFGDGASVLTDTLLIEDIGRCLELTPAYRERQELWDSITDRLKVLGVAYAVAGDSVIEGRQRKDGVVAYEIRRA